MAFLLRLVLLAGVGCFGYGYYVLSAGSPHALAFILILLILHRGYRWKASGWAYGTARAASLEEIAGYHMLSSSGPILGRAMVDPPPRWRAVLGLLWPGRSEGVVSSFLGCYFKRFWRNPFLVRAGRYSHGMTCARTGAGKGVSFILPLLLSHRGSVVVTDPKGENYLIAGGFRAEKLRQRVLKLDPFGITGEGSATFNPLELIDENKEDFLDNSRELAASMVIRTGTEPDPYWNDAAQLVICAIIVFVCACESDRKRRNLATVRKIISSKESFMNAVQEMKKVGSAHGGAISQLGGQLSWLEGKELASVLSSANRHLEFLDSIPVQRSISESSFDLRILRSNRGASLFLILPSNMLESLAGLQRLWIHSIIRGVTAGKPTEHNPVLFVLDECAHLGKLPIIETALSLMRGMGVKLWLILQSLDQLKKCFGDRATTCLDNIDIQQYFGQGSYESADALSKRMGQCTTQISTFNRSSSKSTPGGGDKGGGSTSITSSWNYSEHGRSLLTADEILAMPDDEAIILRPGLRPVFTKLLRYYDAPEFKKGRTGQSRPMGLRALVLSLIVLCAGLGFAYFCIQLNREYPLDRMIMQARQRAVYSDDSGYPVYPTYGRARLR